jgi:hypothetical protein
MDKQIQITSSQINKKLKQTDKQTKNIIYQHINKKYKEIERQKFLTDKDTIY